MADNTLAEARVAFRALSKDDFTELMAYHNPPSALALVCGTALIALGMPKEKDWGDIKKRIVGDPMKFRTAVLELEPEDIKPTRRAVLSKRLVTLESIDMKKVSRLGAALKVWLKAVALPR